MPLKLIYVTLLIQKIKYSFLQFQNVNPDIFCFQTEQCVCHVRRIRSNQFEVRNYSKMCIQQMPLKGQHGTDATINNILTKKYWYCSNRNFLSFV